MTGKVSCEAEVIGTIVIPGASLVVADTSLAVNVAVRVIITGWLPVIVTVTKLPLGLGVGVFTPIDVITGIGLVTVKTHLSPLGHISAWGATQVQWPMESEQSPWS